MHIAFIMHIRYIVVINEVFAALAVYRWCGRPARMFGWNVGR